MRREIAEDAAAAPHVLGGAVKAPQWCQATKRKVEDSSTPVPKVPMIASTAPAARRVQRVAGDTGAAAGPASTSRFRNQRQIETMAA